MEKHILGLDLGTNSIGWAVVKEQVESQESKKSIYKAGSRIIPIDADTMGKFDSGNSVSQTHDRTAARGARRLYERRALRRERLTRVLDILGFLPEHYASCLDRYGKFPKGTEPKLAWMEEDGKNQFLFPSSFQEMCNEFKAIHPELFIEGKKIAYDWTIYYLRKKALSQPITKQELAWILLQANQKRGYYQLRGEEEENTKLNEKRELLSLRVVEVRDTGEKDKDRTCYEIVFENGLIYKRKSAYPLDLVGKTIDLIVTTKLNDDGTEKTDKEGQVKRTLSAPKKDDWGLRKLKTERSIEQSGQTPGEFIYQALLTNPEQKIIGQYVRTIDRQFYKDEMFKIIRKQMEYHPELRDENLYQRCIEALYEHNEAYRKSISSRDFAYLLVQDILFYQRPLKSKKSTISECHFEYNIYKDKDGQWQRQYLKCIPKSHPLYEEFRVWQFVGNLQIFYLKDDGLHLDNVTELFLKDKAALVENLLLLKEVDQKHLLKLVLPKLKDAEFKRYSWNYVTDKTYPMAPVTAMLTKALTENNGFASADEIVHLWHMLYSISDAKELENALKHYAEKCGLNDAFVETLKKIKTFEPNYGAYSYKATKKLLSLMRLGKYWDAEAIDDNTKGRIIKLIAGEDDNQIPDRVREKCKSLQQIEDFQGLPVWLAEYVVYGVRGDANKWEKPEDIDDYLQRFRLHSLNNPIVEQVVKETLRVVRDIWKEVGSIDEIHLEMGRELKKTAAERKNIQERQQENEKANMRAKLLLQEFMNADMGIENVKAYSPSQLELLRIYENDVLAANKPDNDLQKIIDNLSNAKQPTPSEIKRYILWLDQKYKSPYTGQTIPLSKLFTPAYEIEHIIPQSRYFDDSMSNKVICEAEVNKLKDRLLAHEFIMQHGGEKVTLSGGRIVSVLTTQTYEDLVRDTFKDAKRKKLMLDEIPDEFIARQLNDSRHISNLMRALLSNIVRVQDPITKEYEPETTSKNLIVCNGSTTDRLKKDWGINDIWNHLILPRFERMNQLQATDKFTTTTLNGHRIPTMPIELSAGFNKKRIDHRHHAMDAIVIACTTREHVNLLSNEAAMEKNTANRMALQHKLRKAEKVTYNGREHFQFGDFKKPWDNFTQDAEKALNDIIVSFKYNNRVLTKANNHSMRYKEVDGKMKKVSVRQTKGDNLAIRQSLHKATGFGLVNLQLQKEVRLAVALTMVNRVVDRDLRKKLCELLAQGCDEKTIKKYFASEPEAWADFNPQKIAVYYYSNETKDRYYATRKPLDAGFDEKTIINQITDRGIQKILLRHLANNDNDPKRAFSAEGIEEMNQNMLLLNNGHPHKPILRVRIYEKANKFAIGSLGAKAKKFVEAADGTCLYSIFFEIDEQHTRKIIPLRLQDVIEAQKVAQSKWKQHILDKLLEENVIQENYKMLFFMSPGDLVYMPSEQETINGISYNRENIYKVVSLDGENPNFTPHSVASVIVNGAEFTRSNKSSRSLDGRLIKHYCLPLKVDRLGNILAL